MSGSAGANVLEKLRGGLIVSVQAKAGSALDDPHVIAAMAQAAQDAGAAGVRIQGVAHLEAVRKRLTIPVIGLIKRTYPGFEPYITPTHEEVDAILATGADIVAFDATLRSRPPSHRPQPASHLPGSPVDRLAGHPDRPTDRSEQPAQQIAAVIATIHNGGALAMADCATASDGASAAAADADIIATTLCGYTKETQGTHLPALDLVRTFKAQPFERRWGHDADPLSSESQVDEPQREKPFIICEGGVHTPQQGKEAIEAGADAIVVGTAITDLGWVVQRFIQYED